jgi:hypothetical protein
LESGVKLAVSIGVTSRPTVGCPHQFIGVDVMIFEAQGC